MLNDIIQHLSLNIQHKKSRNENGEQNTRFSF